MRKAGESSTLKRIGIFEDVALRTTHSRLLLITFAFAYIIVTVLVPHMGNDIRS